MSDLDTLDALRRSAADLARTAVAPVADRRGPTRGLPDGLAAALDDMGLFGLAVPEGAGGSGLGRVESAVVVAALAEVDASIALLVGLHAAAARLLSAAGARDALDALASASGASIVVPWRPGGSIATAADPGRTWLLAGGPGGTILANDPALVEEARDAERAAEGLRGLDLRRGPSREPGPSGAPLPFDRARAVAEPRLALAAAAIGLARGALDGARAHAAERVQFQQPILRFPAIRAKLVEARVALDGAEALVLREARRLDDGRAEGVDAALARASAVAEAVAHDALQIHGGYGYTRDYPVERAFRDAYTIRYLAEEWRTADVISAAAGPTR